jgi:hypothetical protein
MKLQRDGVRQVPLPAVRPPGPFAAYGRSLPTRTGSGSGLRSNEPLGALTPPLGALRSLERRGFLKTLHNPKKWMLTPAGLAEARNLTPGP